MNQLFRTDRVAVFRKQVDAEAKLRRFMPRMPKSKLLRLKFIFRTY